MKSTNIATLNDITAIVPTFPSDKNPSSGYALCLNVLKNKGFSGAAGDVGPVWKAMSQEQKDVFNTVAKENKKPIQRTKTGTTSYALFQRTVKAEFGGKLPTEITSDFSRAWKTVSKTQKKIWAALAKQFHAGEFAIDTMTQYINISDDDENPITIHVIQLE